MTQPDYMVAKPTEARPKYSLIGTTLDPTLQDDQWVKDQMQRPANPKSVLHDFYSDPFLRMTAYRFEDRMKEYRNADSDYRTKERDALFFANSQPDISKLSGNVEKDNRHMLALNYSKSEMNDKFSTYKRMPKSEIYEMNRIGLHPVPAERLPTGNFNYAKYRPREAKHSFEELGQIVQKAKVKDLYTGEDGQPQSSHYSARFPHIREEIMRNYIAYDAKKDMSRRKYQTLGDALNSEGLPAKIRHKFQLDRASIEGGSAENKGAEIVSDDDIKEMFKKYDETQMQLMEKHIASQNKKHEREKLKEIPSDEQIGHSLRDVIGGGSVLPMESEVVGNFTEVEYQRSKLQLPPPDEARRRKDSYTKWVGLNVLDQKHRQEWRKYLEGKAKPAANI